MPVYRTLRFPDIATADSTQVNPAVVGGLCQLITLQVHPNFSAGFAISKFKQIGGCEPGRHV
jgi:hypothetical protein